MDEQTRYPYYAFSQGKHMLWNYEYTLHIRKQKRRMFQWFQEDLNLKRIELVGKKLHQALKFGVFKGWADIFKWIN